MNDNDILEQSNLYLSQKNAKLKKLILQLTTHKNIDTINNNNKEEVIITQADYIKIYSLYDEWYKCPSCHEGFIQKNHFSVRNVDIKLYGNYR